MHLESMVLHPSPVATYMYYSNKQKIIQAAEKQVVIKI